MWIHICENLVADGRQANQAPTTFRDPYEALTDREKQVLKLVAEGNTNKKKAWLPASWLLMFWPR